MPKPSWRFALLVAMAAIQPLWVMLAGGGAIVLMGLISPLALWKVLGEEGVEGAKRAAALAGGVLFGGLTVLMGGILVAFCLAHLTAR